MGNVSLKVLEKSLIFLVKKGTNLVTDSPNARESRFQNPGNFWLWKLKSLKSGEILLVSIDNSYSMNCSDIWHKYHW